MLAPLIVAVLLAPASSGENGPRLTVWARAGATAWSTCEDLGTEAARTQDDADTKWAIHARQCPHVPEVAVLAAHTEVGRFVRYDLDELEALNDTWSERKHALEVALGWIEDARRESERRGTEPPRGTWFIEGKIHLASGDFASARTAFTHSLRLGEFSPARIRRLLALALLFDGDLEGAVATAHRARLDSVQGPNDVALAHYVWAIVLDRAGDPQAARVALERAFADDRRPGPDFGGSFVDARDPTSELALATVLPVHEAFYFAGIVAARRGDTLGAKRWFRAYLARPEPEAPERRLAERHLAELEDLPTRIGGQSG